MKTLKTIRENKGVTKTAVAQALGVTLKTYSEYEANPQSMKIERAIKAAEFLGVDVSDIFFFSSGK